MKFILEICTDAGKTEAKMTGFPSLEDACACALALAGPRTAGFVHVSCGGKDYSVVTGVCCERKSSSNYLQILESGREALKRLKAEKKSRRARHEWIQAHGGMVFLDLIRADKPACDALFRNDFKAVEAWLALQPAAGKQPLTTQIA